MAKAPRNKILIAVAENDPARYRDRTVKPEKGRGRKQRPRKKDWASEDSRSSYFLAA